MKTRRAGDDDDAELADAEGLEMECGLFSVATEGRSGASVGFLPSDVPTSSSSQDTRAHQEFLEEQALQGITE